MISASLPGEALAQLGQLGQLSHLYPPPAQAGMTPEFLAPPPRPYARYPPRRRDAMPAPPAPPGPPFPSYTPFLPHAFPPYLYRTRAPPQPPPSSYPMRPRPSSGFVPPAPAPHSPPTAPAPAPPTREPVAPFPYTLFPPYDSGMQEPLQPPPSSYPLRPQLSSSFRPPAPVQSPLGALTPPPLTRKEPPMSPERGAPAPYFCRGALIRLGDGSLRRVEEMRTEDFVMSADRSGDLALTQCTLLRLEERGDKLSLTLTYDRNRSQVELESTVEHPFFVYGRGWASCKPERTLGRYGLSVQRLQVGDVCVSLVSRKHASHAPHPPPTAPAGPTGAMLTPAPPQTHPENLSVKEDARKRRWSASDVCEDDRPPPKKR